VAVVVGKRDRNDLGAPAAFSRLIFAVTLQFLAAGGFKRNHLSGGQAHGGILAVRRKCGAPHRRCVRQRAEHSPRLAVIHLAFAALVAGQHALAIGRDRQPVKELNALLGSPQPLESLRLRKLAGSGKRGGGIKG
jgi:hypothetical protein